MMDVVKIKPLVILNKQTDDVITVNDIMYKLFNCNSYRYCWFFNNMKKGNTDITVKFIPLEYLRDARE